jgi:hypothetical protein
VGNYLGTDSSGTQDLGNRFGGAYSYQAPNNTIGGATAGERNVISANYYGVLIYGAAATGNKVMGNYVGTDASGTQGLGNSSDGVYIGNAPNNTIGGATAGERNVISANNSDGVYITGSSATGNRVLSNSIFANGGQGIDLIGTDGPTANDSGDADIGPNNLQNYPEIDSAKYTVLRKVVRKKKKKRVRLYYYTTITGTLDSTPIQTFSLQLFSNPSEDPDEGKTFLGQTNVTTDSNGDASFRFLASQGHAPVGSSVTATATDPNGNTSEFSAPKTVAVQ